MAILTKVVRVDIQKFAPIRFSISSKSAVMSEVVIFTADCGKRTEHINFIKHFHIIKHFHPEKSALAKHTLELDHRMNWS